VPTIDEKIRRRFDELEAQLSQMRFTSEGRVEEAHWTRWATSVLNLLHNAFGIHSVHEGLFQTNYMISNTLAWSLEQAKGIFLAAKSDYEGGYIFNLQHSLTGEIVGDFVALAKAAMARGDKDVAAVLASAALEDALKRYAREQGLFVDDQVMESVVSGLKSKGLVSGAQKSLLDTMPKLRNYAMHANWDKLTMADVGSIVGFVEQFLLTHF